MNRVWQYSLLLSCALLAGCAGSAAKNGNNSPANDDSRLGERVNTVCFASRLSGFQELGSDALILRRAPGEEYMVRTGFCPNLDFVEGLKIDSPDNCLRRGDRLLVFDTPFPMKDSLTDKPDRCLVTDIHRWNNNATNEQQD